MILPEANLLKEDDWLGDEADKEEVVGEITQQGHKEIQEDRLDVAVRRAFEDVTTRARVLERLFCLATPAEFIKFHDLGKELGSQLRTGSILTTHCID